jgi:hypothetical protein
MGATGLRADIVWNGALSQKDTLALALEPRRVPCVIRPLAHFCPYGQALERPPKRGRFFFVCRARVSDISVGR